MDNDELHARFAGLRIALAYAIKAASRSPADLNHHREALREIESLIPATLHPAVKEELDGVIIAITRLPVRDPTHGHEPAAVPVLAGRDAELPRDMLT